MGRHSKVVHVPPEHIEPIYRWFKKAQIDYTDQYIKMYIAYNAWYREITGSTNDRIALTSLKTRGVIWDDYAHGRALVDLKPYMDRLTDLTQKEPVGKTAYWSGMINNAYDWHSLIEFWYQIRCSLVHGANVNPKYVWLAYETLDTFLTEIIERMQARLQDATYESSSENNKVPSQSIGLQEKIYNKYISSPDIWQVDMQRAH